MGWCEATGVGHLVATTAVLAITAKAAVTTAESARAAIAVVVASKAAVTVTAGATEATVAITTTEATVTIAAITTEAAITVATEGATTVGAATTRTARALVLPVDALSAEHLLRQLSGNTKRSIRVLCDRSLDSLCDLIRHIDEAGVDAGLNAADSEVIRAGDLTQLLLELDRINATTANLKGCEADLRTQKGATRVGLRETEHKRRERVRHVSCGGSV